MRNIALLIFILFFQYPVSAYAYVGPGLGLGTLGVIFGIFASIFFAIVGIFYYPIKRIMRKFRKKAQGKNVCS